MLRVSDSADFYLLFTYDFPFALMEQTVVQLSSHTHATPHWTKQERNKVNPSSKGYVTPTTDVSHPLTCHDTPPPPHWCADVRMTVCLLFPDARRMGWTNRVELGTLTSCEGRNWSLEGRPRSVHEQPLQCMSGRVGKARESEKTKI